MKIQDARSLPPVAQEDLRRKVIQAVMEGKKQVEVAELFGVTRQAVGKWVRRYRKGGKRALVGDTREGAKSNRDGSLQMIMRM